MKVREIMTKGVVTCMPEESVADVAKRMCSYDIGLLVVVEDNISKHAVGVLSNRDVLSRVVVKGLDPDKTKVEQVMTKKVIAVSPDDTISSAVERMKKERVKRLVVFDHTQATVGIISESDLMKELMEIKKRLLELTGNF